MRPTILLSIQLAVLSIGLAAAPADADAPKPAPKEDATPAPPKMATKRHKDAGVSVDIPANWKIEADEKTMTAVDPKEEAVAMLVVSEADSMKKVGDAIDVELGKIAKDIKWGPQTAYERNGLKGITMKGTGKIDGKFASMDVVIVVVPATKKGVFLLQLAETSKEAAHRAELQAIHDSLKPLTTAPAAKATP